MESANAGDESRPGRYAALDVPKKIKPGGAALPLRKTAAADEAAVELNSDEGLARAGFAVDANAQQRFVSRISQGLYTVPRVTVRPEVLPGAGAAACLLAAGLRLSVGDAPAALAAGLAGAGHLGFFAYGLKRTQDRRRKQGDDDLRAAYDEGGELQLRLEAGERVLKEAALAPPTDRGIAAGAAGLFQALWGLLLGGLPLALGGASAGALGVVLTALATLIGTGIFGRGVRALVAMRPVKKLVLTDRRLALIAAPGAARTLFLDDLRHRPLLLARGEGRATLAIDVRAQEATAPLPLMGLVGMDDLDEEEGKAWAAAVMDARRALLDDKA